MTLHNNTKLLYKVISCVLFAWLFSLQSFAVDSIVKVKTDSSKIEVRRLPDAAQKKLLESSAYKYDRVRPAPKGLWDRFTEWLSNKISELFETKEGALSFRIFEWILAIAAVVIIVFLLLKNDVRRLFYGQSASLSIDFSEFEEDINKIDFDKLIEESIAKKDFRKAVRLHFLKLLKQLTDNNLIKWQIDKTNKDYSIELSNSKYKVKFNQLSLAYEYIWYGDFQLDETIYKETISQFNSFRL